VLVCSERKVVLPGCWWLVCSERKVLLADKFYYGFPLLQTFSKRLFPYVCCCIICSYLFTGRKRATNPQPFRISKWAGQAESQTKSPYVLVWRRRRGIPQRMMTSISGDCSPPLPHSTARVLWRPVVTVLGSGPRIEVEQSVSACNP
jgi:hypothetical protein